MAIEAATAITIVMMIAATMAQLLVLGGETLRLGRLAPLTFDSL